MSMDFFEAVKKRRSVYALAGQAQPEAAKIAEILQTCMQAAPAAFAMQTARVALLAGEHHAKLWQITEAALQKLVPPEKFAATQKKIAMFAAARGTVLYYIDGDTLGAMQAKFPAYKESAQIWAQQGIGMLQYMVWAALAADGIGANLQHYNPLIDADVQKQFNIPPAWQLIAQMPFGAPQMFPPAKPAAPSDWVKVFE